MFGRELPTEMLIYKWYKLFGQTGKSPRTRKVTEAQVDTVRAAFVRSSHKSNGRGARQLNMSQTIKHVTDNSAHTSAETSET
jgi:hypothetical protein